MTHIAMSPFASVTKQFLEEFISEVLLGDLMGQTDCHYLDQQFLPSIRECRKWAFRIFRHNGLSVKMPHFKTQPRQHGHRQPGPWELAWVAAGKGVGVAELNDSLSVFHFYSDRQMATCRQAI